MSDAEMARGAGAAGRHDEHGRASGPVPRPGSDGEHALQQRLGTTARADRFYDQQMLDHLNPRMREFVRSQEMFFLATADRHGRCDNSFRAGPPGFLRVLDDRTLLYPEYRGNGVHASLGNLQENPHVGILLMDFLRARIGLHVNGRAEICEDVAIRAEFPDLPVDPVPGRRAQLWVRVRVQEAYIHCAKHIPHLQKVPRGAGREWGTDDHKRKGGDFFGTAREARERGPVEWQPREHEAPREHETPRPAEPAAPAAVPDPVGLPPAGPAPYDPVPLDPPPVIPAPVLSPGQVPAPPSVPTTGAPGVIPEAPTPPPVPGHAPEQAPAAAQYQGPRHARGRVAPQTPVAAWRARRQSEASHSSHPAPSHAPPPPGSQPLTPGNVPGPGHVPGQPSAGQPAVEGPSPGRQDAQLLPDVPPQPNSHGHGQVHGHGLDGPPPYESFPGQSREAFGAGPSVEGSYPPGDHAFVPASAGDGYDAYPSTGDGYPSAGHDESYAAGWHTVSMRGSQPRGPVPPGGGAVAGASAAIAARAATGEEDADAWRQEAERALADAQRRVGDEELSSFQGWFG